MKKSFLILLSAVILLFTACDSWMQDDDFYADIENDVKVANAQQISVFVRYALTRQGKTDPDGPATFKVEIPHQISAITEPEYGFVRWAAFSTDFLSTGDNQTKNKDVYFIDEEDYRVRLAPKEIKAPAVVFEDATKPETKVKINVNRNDIFIVPIVTQRPAISLTIPAKGQANVVRNMAVRINFSKPMDPASFKNEAGEYDKIVIEQGTQAFGADGDIEIVSNDITHRFENPVFSKNKKMITLKFKDSEINEGYTANSIISVTVSKDVKDSYGFTMAEDDKVSFSIGSFMDTLAPRITQLNAWRTLDTTDSAFKTFEGMYKDAATHDHAGTPMKDWQLSGTDIGADDAPAANLNNAFFDPFAPLQSSSETGYRVSDSIYIRVYAEDIAASGSGITDLTEKLSEADVAMVGARATLMYAADGSVPATPVVSDPVAFNYLPQNKSADITGSYQTIIGAINDTIEGTDNDYNTNVGYLFKYTFADTDPDGLYRIDVFAVDMVQNSGLGNGGIYSAEYGNGYASLFVVKDTTPPNAADNAGKISLDTSHTTPAHYFNNIPASNYYRNYLKLTGEPSFVSSTASIVDSGHERLRSKHNNIKWNVKLSEDTATGWHSITSDLTGFPEPPAQGQINFTYSLQDDLGNVSSEVTISPAQPVYYDSVAPSVQTPAWQLVNNTSGETEGSAKTNVISNQKLVIPVTEVTSGIKSLEVLVRKEGAASDYATPFGASYTVTAAGSAISGSESGRVFTFTDPQTFNASTIEITGLKITDASSGTALEGRYTVTVKAKDAADNEYTTTSGAVISIDNTAPAVEKVYIPNLKKAVRAEAPSTTEYWADYAMLDRSGSIPTTDVYIVFNEADSGARVFDFTTSSLKLTSDSQIFAADPVSLSVSAAAIPGTVDTTNNILTITSPNNAIINGTGTSHAAVKITKVQLATAPAASNIAIKVRDTATNVATTAYSTIESAEGTTPLTGITSFKYEDPGYYSYTSALILKDNVVETGCIEAEAGYTNSEYVNAKVTLAPSNSGIYKLTLSGNAVFSTDAAHPTKFTRNNNLWSGSAVPASDFLEFDLSSDGKTVIFKHGTDHAVIGLQASAGNHRANGIELYIKDLKLTDSTDGDKVVSIKAESFYGLPEATSPLVSYTIKLDKTRPEWVDQADGTPGRLYAGYLDTDVNSDRTARIYPHPVPTTEGYAYGITVPNPNPSDPSNPGTLNDTNGNPILHFYQNLSSSSGALYIYPKYNEDNPKTAVCNFVYQGTGSTPVQDSYALYSDQQYGTWTAQLRDKAGNLSEIVQTFKIVKDNSFVDTTTDTTSLTNIKHYFTLEEPANAKLFTNPNCTTDTFTTSQSSQYKISTSIIPGTGSTSRPKVYNYVIKGNPDTNVKNTGYKIKFKLTTGLSSTDTLLDETTPASNDPALNTKFALMKATANSTPIEYYAISHWYSSYAKEMDENDPYVPAFPDTDRGFDSTGQSQTIRYTDKTNWHKYKTTTGYNTDTDIDSRIDEDGNLEILLPNKNTPPLSVLLKDGCGNFIYVLVKQAVDNSSNDMFWDCNMPAWIPDSSVGTHYSYYSSASQISNPRPGNSNGVNFYRNGAQYSFYDCSDTCTYTSSVVANSSNYTLKSRVIVWTGSTAPSQSDFYFTTPTTIAPAASDWNYKTSTGGSITMAHELPHYIATSPYKLYSIIEDRVGNCEIYQLLENTSSPVTDSWFYDNTVPTTTVSTAVKVNTVNDGTAAAPVMKNYYSPQSTVIYDITDNESGIKSTASETFSFTSFNARETSKTGISYPLGNYTPGTGGAMSISGVVNWAGGEAASASLSYNGSGVWVKQSTPPALLSSGLTAVNTTDWYKDRARYDVGTAIADQTTAADSTHPDGGGQLLLTITSKAVNTDIDLKLPSSTSSTDSTRLLGWVVSDSPLTSFADFYYPSDSTDTNANATNKVSSLVTYDSTAGAFIYHYNKPNGTLSYNAWYGNIEDKYFYPVNRAGLIRKQPIKVTFAQNLVPSLKNNAVTSYSGNNSSGNETIHAYGTGNNRVNYTKTGASVTFTTVNNPTTCWIIYGKGADNKWGTSDDDHKEFTLNSYRDTSVTSSDPNYPQYTIPLDDDALKLSDKEFRLMLSTTSEDSSPYPLTGPAGYNKWTFDETAPTVSFGASDIKTVKSDNTEQAAVTSVSTSDVTRYIQSEKARISLTLTSGGTSTTPTDIDKYQWKVGSADWADINTTNASTLPYLALPAAGSSTGVITFTAPAAKTNYQFRVIDKAGNVSATTAFSSSATSYNTIQLQRDDAAPTGTIDFDILSGTTSKLTSLTNTAGENLVELSPAGSTAATATEVTIYYSSRSENTSSYINKLKLDFTGITDNAGGEGKSGIQNYQISTDGGNNWTSITKSAMDTASGIQTYTLTNGANGTTVYKFKFKDNINQESQVLKTITLIAYGTEPTLTAPTEHAVQTKENISAAATDAATKTVSSQTHYYFKENTLAVLNFTISDAAHTTYQYTANANAATPTWTAIPNSDINGSANSLAFTVNANDLSATAAAYQVRAIDKVGNITTSSIYYLAKDAAAPTGTFDATKYKFKVSESGSDTAAGYFTDTATTEGESTYQLLRYNTSQASHIEFNFDAITDADSGILSYIWNDGATDTVWNAPITSKTITIPTGNAVYTLSVKDKVGHVTLLKKFKFVADNSTPVLAAPVVASQKSGEADYTVTPAAGTYWIKGDNALITLSATDAGGDLAYYGWRQGTSGDFTFQASSSNTVTIEATNFASAAKTYQFCAKDAVGHTTAAQSVTLQQDATAPTGTLAYSVNNGTTAKQIVNAGNPVADYTETTDAAGVKTITFNPNSVDNIVFSGISDALSRLAGYYNRTASGDVLLTDNKIELTSTMNGTDTYSIIAKDNAGNELINLGSFKFVADGAGPVFNTNKVTDFAEKDDGNNVIKHVKQIHSYTNSTGANIPYARWKQYGGYQKTNYYTSGLYIMYAKTDIPEAVEYQLVRTQTTGSTASTDGYTATAVDTNWVALSDGTADRSGANYIFTIPDIHDPHTRLSFFFRDALGNVSGPYYLGNNLSNQAGVQWWITAPELSSSNVRISTVTPQNATNPVGWNNTNKDYLVSINLPIGAVITSIALSPAQNGNNTGVVWTSASGVKDQIQFTDCTAIEHTSGTATLTGDKTRISHTDSSAVGLKLKIYVHPKKDGTNDIVQADPKIIINGTIELPVFPEGGYHNIATSGALDFVPGGSLNPGDEEETPKSRAAQFFSSVADVFARNRAVEVGEQSSVEKPVVSEKKAKKAAKKAKKTADKVVSTGSITAGKGASTAVTGSSTVTGATAEKQAMAVETAEILAQNEKSTLPEIEVATESIVNEIDGVTEKVNAAEQVVSIRPEDYSTTGATEEEGSASSKSAIIVIMLAILSSLGGAWYYLKARKK